MKNLFSERIAIYGLLSILSLVVIFHVLVISGVIPFEIVWGGRLQDASQMIRFETVSILLNLSMLAAVSIYSGLIKVHLNSILLKITLWFMFGLFFLNTIGNILSNNQLEKIIFTPITVLLTLFSFRLAIIPRPKS